jgi:hypothetical protein
MLGCCVNLNRILKWNGVVFLEMEFEMERCCVIGNGIVKWKFAVCVEMEL